MIPVAIVVVTGTVLFCAAGYLPPGTSAPGVHFGGLTLGQQPQDGVKTSIEAAAVSLTDLAISLHYSPPPVLGKEHSWSYTAKQLGLGVDIAATVQKAMDAGHESLPDRAVQKLTGRAEAHAIDAVAQVDSAVLTAEIKRLAHMLHHAPVNAKLHVADDGEFKILPSKDGLEVDVTATAEAIKRKWNEVLTSASATERGQELTTSADKSVEKPAAIPVTIDLATAELKPTVDADAIAHVDGVIAEMKTRIRGTPERVRNVTIATHHIDGTTLGAGETFSYNQVVGRRSEEGGYQKATIFVKGRHVEDVGGGICQTASTLYNAVLRAGLHVVRRQPHCTPVVYVPYGLDATVAYGAVDFQFQNDTEEPVYVYARAKGRSLTFRLYSKKNPGRKVVLEKIKQTTTPTTTTVVQDKTLPHGKRLVKDKGAPGYTIIWRRTIADAGKEPRVETIRSHYKPVTTLIAVGPGGVSAPLPGVKLPMPVQSKSVVKPPVTINNGL